MTRAEALEKLIDGNKAFIASKSNNSPLQTPGLTTSFESQDPFAIILGCADSRVSPELIFNAGLGELFTIRVAGNIANTATIASIEYAIAVLKPKVIVVLAHQNCGAVASAMQGIKPTESISALVDYISPVIDGNSNDSSQEFLAKENAKKSIQDILAKSPLIKKAIDSRDVEIQAAYFSIESGKVEFLN